MSIRNFDHLLKPASIVIVDTFEQANRYGVAVGRNLIKARFQGEITAVLPNGALLEGIPTTSEVSNLNRTPELAIVRAAPGSLTTLISQLGARGTKAMIILGDEHDGIDHEQLHRRDAPLIKAAQPYGMRILGPDSLGIMVPRARINGSISDIQISSGNVALVNQSGTALIPLLQWATARNLGFSHVISLGRMADVDCGDVLDYLANDEDTRVVLLLLGSLPQMRKFISAGRAATRNLPVVALHLGRFQRPHWSSPSSWLPEDKNLSLYEAVFARCGILLVSQLEELLGAAQILTTVRSLAGNRFAIIANGRDLAMLAADTLLEQGGRLAMLTPESMQRLRGWMVSGWAPGLPLDLGIDADGNRYSEVLQVLLADPEIDVVVVLHAANALSPSLETAEAVIDSLKKRTAKSPAPMLVTAWMGDSIAAEARQILTRSRIPSYDTPDAVVRAAMLPIRYRQLQDRLIQTVPPLPGSFVPEFDKAQGIISQALTEGRTWLGGPQAKDILAAYGVPVVPSRMAANPAAAAEIARTMDQSVVLKILSPDIARKSAVGGVVLNLHNPRQVKQAATSMWKHIGSTLPQASLQGFGIEPMVRLESSHELMIAVMEEARLGPVVLFGQGGSASDAIWDLEPALMPLDFIRARELIERTRLCRLLRGTPGIPAADLEAIALTLVKISQLVCDLDAVVEIHINPLFAWNQGVVVVDAWMRIDGKALPAAQRLAIRPYPKEFEETLKLPDGQVLLLRPIRAEDEPLYVELFESLSPDEVFFRFLNRIKILPHHLSARLTQLDYDRDMALVLVGQRPSGEKVLYGGSRIMADPDMERAEFAVLLRTDMTGLGLGPLLLRRIIDYAKNRGFSEIYGEILSDNRPMLKLCQVFGFSAKRSLDDPGITNVSLDLGGGRS